MALFKQESIMTQWRLFKNQVDQPQFLLLAGVYTIFHSKNRKPVKCLPDKKLLKVRLQIKKYIH